MTEEETIIKGYKDEISQWWILTEGTEEDKRKELELRAILWYNEAKIKAAFAEVCLSILQTPPIVLPEVSLVEYNHGQDHTT